jgi:RNA polymerase sigma-70 factor (ECF subfamily)
LRLAPPASPPRRQRLDELERVIGREFIVDTMHKRDVDAVANEAKQLHASVIVLDVGARLIGSELVGRAHRENIAVVVAPHTDLGRDDNGRETARFSGYKRLTKDGELIPLEDGELG